MEQYIIDQIEKLNELAKSGVSSEEILPVFKSVEELIIKNIEMKKNVNDPNRLQEFGTPDNKGFGSM